MRAETERSDDVIDLDCKGVRAESTRKAQAPIPRPAWYVLPDGTQPKLRVPFSRTPLRKLHKRGAGKLRASSTPFRVRSGYMPNLPGSV